MFIARFLEQVRAHPLQTAVLDGGRPVTYADLFRQAQNIATALHKKGIGVGSVVGLHLSKSASYVASLLGVWMVRAAFVPIALDLPVDRQTYLATQSGATLVLTEGETPHFDSVLSLTDVRNAEDFIVPTGSPSDLAYIIYTSGSSGAPKGVMVSHRGLVPVLDEQIALIGLGVGKRSLFLLSTSFDASLSDIGTALLSGATLCIEPKENLYPAERLLKTIERLGIHYMDIPPSLLATLPVEHKPSTLETLLIGGEVCPPETVRAWAAQCRLINVYGPTEATICTSMVLCSPEVWDAPLIGFPLLGIVYRVLDEAQRVVNVGSEGELYIASATALAVGYLNDPVLTTDKFLEIDGIRYYRTGDRVRRHADDNHEFLGRIDRQFKIRGQLVEPSEVESCLLSISGIKRASVMKRPLSSGLDGLVAFIQTDHESLVPAPFLRRALTQKLAAWMVPDKFVYLDSFPQNANGKVDVVALRQLDITNVLQKGCSVSSHTQILLDIVSNVLQIAPPHPNEEFYALGGDSLSALQLVLSAEKVGFPVTLDLLAQRLSLDELAHAVDTKTQSENSGAVSSHLLDSLVQLPPLFATLDVLPTCQPCAQPTSILITGATGFLGSRVLYEQMKNNAVEVYCLVRAIDEKAAKERIRLALERTRLELTPEQWKRVHVCCGDIERKNLGLTAETLSFLTEEIDLILHCAAHVNMVLSYEQLWNANVTGCLNILTFAVTGKKKQVDYASTLSVFVATNQNAGVVYEHDPLDDTKEIYGGYAQTKWAAERLMRRAAKVLPINIYRFGLVTGDVETGVAAEADFLTLFVKGLLRLRCVPANWLDRLWMDVTPRSYAAAAMLTLARHNYGTVGGTYHLAGRQSVSLGMLVSALQAEGLSLQLVGEEEWQDRVHKQAVDAETAAVFLSLCRTDKKWFRQHRSFDLFQATDVSFDQTRANAVLVPENILCPAPSMDLIRLYMRGILETIIPAGAIDA